MLTHAHTCINAYIHRHLFANVIKCRTESVCFLCLYLMACLGPIGCRYHWCSSCWKCCYYSFTGQAGFGVRTSSKSLAIRQVFQQVPLRYSDLTGSPLGATGDNDNNCPNGTAHDSKNLLPDIGERLNTVWLTLIIHKIIDR